MPQPPESGGSAAVEALYQELILDHYRRPRHKGVLEPPAVSATVANPVCGETMTVAATVEGGRVREAMFTGQSCAISQASASMMTDLVRGKTSAEVSALLARLAELLRGNADAARDPALGDLRALAGVARIPIRIPCALLSWRGLMDALRTDRASAAPSQ
jgi:nitrogen fixation protein NifU and related proteins